MQITHHIEVNVRAEEWIEKYELPHGLQQQQKLLQQTGDDFKRISKTLKKKLAAIKTL